MKKIEFDDISSSTINKFFTIVKLFLLIFVVFVVLFSVYSEFSEGHWILGSLIVLFIVFIPLGIYFFGEALEAGFRNRFPYDYVTHLGYEANFLRGKGFEEIGYIAPGSDNPGIEYVFAHNDLVYNAQVILDAPLNGEFKTSVLLSDKDGNEIGKVEYPTGSNQEYIKEKLDGLMYQIHSKF